MQVERAPESYEELIRMIHERYDGMSKSHQQIAVFLTQNPNDVAVMSVNGVAETCGLHASSLVRFAQSFGYAGFKSLQSVFQRRLSTAAPAGAPATRSYAISRCAMWRPFKTWSPVSVANRSTVRPS